MLSRSDSQLAVGVRNSGSQDTSGGDFLGFPRLSFACAFSGARSEQFLDEVPDEFTQDLHWGDHDLSRVSNLGQPIPFLYLSSRQKLFQFDPVLAHGVRLPFLHNVRSRVESRFPP